MRAAEQIKQQATPLDNTSGAIFVPDLSGRVTFLNKGAEKVYGWTREEILGENLITRVLPQFRERESIYKILVERGEFRGELFQVGQEGKELIIDSRMTLVRGRDENPESPCYINADITEKKRLHQQFLRAQRLENIGTLAGGIAHDLNNVLQPIMLSLVHRRIHDEKGLKLVEMLSESVRRAVRLVNQGHYSQEGRNQSGKN